MKKFLAVVCSVVIALSCAGCARQTGKKDPLQLIKDSTYANGFNLLGIVSNESGSQAFDKFFVGSQEVDPVWNIAQWGNKYNLATTDAYMSAEQAELYPLAGKRSEKDGVVTFANAGVSFSVNTVANSLKLTLIGDKLYDAPRQNGDPWPHLLLTQSIGQPLSAAASLSFEAQFSIDWVIDRMDAQDYDPALHTCQFQFYLSLIDNDPQSAGRGQAMWFGIPFYDYRQRLTGTDLYYGQDGGKEDATGYFIYKLASSDYIEGPAEGRDLGVRLELSEFIRTALQKAHEEGYMQGTEYESLTVSSMNIGWELQGTFNVSATLKKISVVMNDA